MFLKVACWATFVSLSMMAILHLYISEIQKAVTTPRTPAPTMIISNFEELFVKNVSSLHSTWVEYLRLIFFGFPVKLKKLVRLVLFRLRIVLRHQSEVGDGPQCFFARCFISIFLSEVFQKEIKIADLKNQSCKGICEHKF